jgi:hypothetical protein
VYVRVQKLFLSNYPHSRLTLFQSIGPENSGVHTPLVRLAEPNMFVSSSILALTTVPSPHSQLSFVVSEFHESFGDVQLARLVLPIMWFPLNKVVSCPFPMITRHADDETPLLLLDVHLSRGHVGAFSAPLGKLYVVPTWPIPAFMNPEKPEPPPEERQHQPPQEALQQPPAELLPVAPMAALIAQELVSARRRPPRAE